MNNQKDQYERQEGPKEITTLALERSEGPEGLERQTFAEVDGLEGSKDHEGPK